MRDGIHSDSSRKLDQVTRSDVVAGQERREGIDRVIDTSVLREVDLGVREDDHGSIGTVSDKLARQGEANGVVERQTERFVSVFTALAVEEVGLEIVQKREESAALLILSSASEER